MSNSYVVDTNNNVDIVTSKHTSNYIILGSTPSIELINTHYYIYCSNTYSVVTLGNTFT